MRRHPTSASIPSWIVRVAWVVSDLSLMSPGIEIDGIQVEHFAPLTAPSGWASIRVLPFSSFLDEASLRAEYERDASPALFLTRNEGEVLLAHEIANEHDDVESEQAPPFVIGRRLNRMQWRIAATALVCDSTSLDPLTGLINRQEMEAQWPRLFERDASLSRWSFFLLDIDHFKQVNDTYGHIAGDQVLAAVASLLLQALPTASLITRWGGEEFAWLITHADEATSQDLAEAVLRTIRQSPIYLAIHITASIGFAPMLRGLDLRQAIEAANLALYAAKARGRDQALSYTQIEDLAEEAGSNVKLLHFQNVTRVVTERTANLLSNFGRSLVQEAQRAAEEDQLTRVWNRRYFDRRFSREVDLAKRQATPLSIAVFDLDHFGTFNKVHGMPTGDAVLASFARVTLLCVRASDWIARYGGEEFVVVVRGVLADAVDVAERIRAAVESNVIDGYGGQRVRATVSAGVAELNDSISGPTDLVQVASERLQKAKREGRNRVESGP